VNLRIIVYISIAAIGERGQVLLAKLQDYPSKMGKVTILDAGNGIE
jgi:hypothetical protein